MKSLKSLIAVVACSLIALPAFALSLDDAKAKGLVGERADGYVGVVSGGAEVQQLADQVNKLRKAEYQKIAAKNGQDVGTVEKLAAEKLIGRAGAGQFVMGAGGNWVKK